MVFIAEHLRKMHHETVGEMIEMLEGVEIYTYLVEYEDELPEYRKPAKRKTGKKKA